MTHQERAKQPSIKDSLQEYGRGIAGGLLFSLPLLYTMEVWWMGFVAEPWRLLVYLAATFGLLLAFNRYAGLHEGASFREVVVDSVEEMGIGLVLAAAVLWVTSRISVEQPASEVIGKIVIEGMTVAIGVSVGTAQLGAADDRQERNENRDIGTWGELLIALCGATLVCSNVAPTEEILLMGVETPPLALAILAVASLALIAIVLEFSEFRGSRRMTAQAVPLPCLFGGIASYGMALISSAFMLWFYNRFEGMGLATIIAQVVILAAPAAIGASAGRLLLRA